ncbi:MAG TPA: pilus assembly protein TadG-related protein [Chloroflexota bacterium]|nr:pilus assembly protein TadG-related protein [Chloroflexota bacterium]
MRRERLDSVMRWCRGWQALSTRRVKGQIAYMAVLLTSLMGLAGAGVDYGLIVVESARLQNALDAGVLAGARALVLSTAATQGAATNPASGTRNYDDEQAAKAFLVSNGYNVTGLNGVTFTFSSSASVKGASNDTMQINGTVVKPTSFWKAIGINSTTITQRATAVSTGGMVDVMLSLDLTGSMEMSGNDDLGNLRNAVNAFIDQMQLSTTVTRGTRMGIARWAGVNCSWWRGTSSSPPAGAADNDRYIDMDKGATPGAPARRHARPTAATTLPRPTGWRARCGDHDGRF